MSFNSRTGTFYLHIRESLNVPIYVLQDPFDRSCTNFSLEVFKPLQDEWCKSQLPEMGEREKIKILGPLFDLDQIIHS